MRAIGAAVLTAAALTALTSCSAFGGGPAAAVTSSTENVQDPSIPTATPTVQVASDTPLPTATATAVATSAPTSGPAARTAVTPFITNASWDASSKALDVSAIVPGVVESGGTCTVTVRLGSTTRSATGHGVAASSYTGCEAVSFASLAAGTWTVDVAYASSKSAGTSKTGTVRVG